MGGIYGCGFKEVYNYIDFLILLIPIYSSCICSFWQQHPYFFVLFFNVSNSAAVVVDAILKENCSCSNLTGLLYCLTLIRSDSSHAQSFEIFS